MKTLLLKSYLYWTLLWIKVKRHIFDMSKSKMKVWPWYICACEWGIVFSFLSKQWIKLLWQSPLNPMHETMRTSWALSFCAVYSYTWGRWMQSVISGTRKMSTMCQLCKCYQKLDPFITRALKKMPIPVLGDHLKMWCREIQIKTGL